MLVKQTGELPETKLVRKQILKATPSEAKFGLMAEYLFCARACEIVARKCPSDISTTPRGLTGKDVKLDTYSIADQKYDVVIFTLRTAKRDGKVRLCALPLDKEYEPLSEPLMQYIKKFDDYPAFNYTRQTLHNFAKSAFEGFTYRIDAYTKKSDDPDKKRDKVHAHDKPFKCHALRHLRTAELIEHYGFDGIEMSAYGGWTLQSALGIGSSLGRYAHLNWQKYFPKLLKPLRA